MSKSPDSKSPAPQVGDTLAANAVKRTRLELWVAILGTLVTILLTLFNAYTKSRIDETEQKLKEVDLSIRGRAQEVEETKQRIASYTWVQSLLEQITSEDQKKKELTLSLIRLALTEKEAEKMFSGFQASSSKDLQLIGQSGMFGIQNEPLAKLVSQLSSPDKRISSSALAELLSVYNVSSKAIDFALRPLEEGSIRGMSLDGLINSLQFLKGTVPTTWNKEEVFAARRAIVLLRGSDVLPRGTVVLDEFERFLEETQQAPR